MIYLSEEDTRRLVNVDDALEMIRQAALWDIEGKVTWSEPGTSVLHTKNPKSRYRIKACTLEAIPVVGIRMIGYPPGGEGAQGTTRFVLLSDPGTGAPLALIDDHWSFGLRTAASAVTGLSYLLPKKKLIVGMVGSGNLARAIVQILKHRELIDRVVVTSRRAESRAQFAKEISEAYGVKVQLADAARDVVKEADLVITATNANAQMVSAQWIRPGTTLCTLGRYELDPELYRRADQIVVDSWEVSQEVPDIIELIDKGILSKEKLSAEMPELIVGSKAGRKNDAETIIFRTDGLVSQDVAISYSIYKNALTAGVGINLDAVPVG